MKKTLLLVFTVIFTILFIVGCTGGRVDSLKINLRENLSGSFTAVLLPPDEKKDKEEEDQEGKNKEQIEKEDSVVDSSKEEDETYENYKDDREPAISEDFIDVFRDISKSCGGALNEITDEDERVLKADWSFIFDTPDAIEDFLACAEEMKNVVTVLPISKRKGLIYDEITISFSLNESLNKISIMMPGEIYVAKFSTPYTDYTPYGINTIGSNRVEFKRKKPYKYSDNFDEYMDSSFKKSFEKCGNSNGLDIDNFEKLTKGNKSKALNIVNKVYNCLILEVSDHLKYSKKYLKEDIKNFEKEILKAKELIVFNIKDENFDDYRIFTIKSKINKITPEIILTFIGMIFSGIFAVYGLTMSWRKKQRNNKD